MLYSSRRPHRRSLALSVPLLALTLLLLVACQQEEPTPSPTQAQPTPTPKGEPERGGIVSFAIHEGPGGFDLHRELAYVAMQPIGPLYNGLVTFNMYNYPEIVPDLAESWEVGDEGRTLIFKLRQGVKFHDGTPFTCADAAYSVQKMVDFKRSRQYTIMTGNLESAECQGSTLTIRLKRPQASFFRYLATSGPAMMKADAYETMDPKQPTYLVGTGPFVFEEYAPGVSFKARRNPSYWKEGLPYVDGFTAFIIGDLSRIWASFRVHQLTMTGIARHLEPPQAKIIQESMPQVVIAEGPRSAWDNFVMNVQRPPLDNPDVRLAIALATDKEAMIDFAVGGWGTVGAYVPPHSEFALPPQELKEFPQFGEDMAQRRQMAQYLLAGAGYSDGLDLELLVRTGPLYEQGAIARQADLKQVGIDLTVTILDTATINERVNAGDYVAHTIPGAKRLEDPDDFFVEFVCEHAANRSGYCNEEFDQLYRQQSQSQDTQERIRISHQMERILLQDIPDDRGYYWRSTMAYWDNLQDWVQVTGITVYSFGRFERVWCLEGDCNG